MQVVEHIDLVDYPAEGGQLLHAAVLNEQPSIVDLLIKRGANVLEPPTTIGLLQEEYIHYARKGLFPGYIERPFIILAAAMGNL